MSRAATKHLLHGDETMQDSPKSMIKGQLVIKCIF